MDFYDYYSESQFESFKKKKKSKKKKKFFKKLIIRVIDKVLSTVSQIVLNFFDKKFEKAFA